MLCIITEKTQSVKDHTALKNRYNTYTTYKIGSRLNSKISPASPLIINITAPFLYIHLQYMYNNIILSLYKHPIVPSFP